MQWIQTPLHTHRQRQRADGGLGTHRHQRIPRIPGKLGGIPKDIELKGGVMSRDLREAIIVLKQLDAEYEKRQIACSAKKDYDKALRIRQARIGIVHSIKTIEKMTKGIVGVLG